ncbi:uncharacterized protein si:dkey-192g7.3 [Silurus meridionalis]|uniref:Ig-like domain-containing protein n=1 Tax=Silurus meridionalis TaxID=175797 RepID=A0A8T0BQ59_SILME|nr:uncharacterized protein si:dkey-192g7.3 [Silurus meridionalis]XP_046701854.1 uncharacterized protein si:dkey-192g7.3 [Silurus meridionalis]KAF7709452.1 hypothetical protein HF521_016302 [Silurus meridionalis]
MSRSAVVMWLLAVFCFDSKAAKTSESINVIAGQNVMLPCPCSEDTERVVWQIGEEIVVNQCCENHPQDQFYVNRTQVFLLSAKGNCSLLLRNVALKDATEFTCYTFDSESFQDMQKVTLNVEEPYINSQSHTSSHIVLPTPGTRNEPHTGFSVGVPITLILVILFGLIVALFIRKHRQRQPRMMEIEKPHLRLPIVDHTPV